MTHSSGKDDSESKYDLDSKDDFEIKKNHIAEIYQFTFTIEDIDNLPVNSVDEKKCIRFDTFEPLSENERIWSNPQFLREANRDLCVNGISFYNTKLKSMAEFLQLLRNIEHTNAEKLAPDDRLEIFKHEVDLQTCKKLFSAYSQSPLGLLWSIAFSQIPIAEDIVIFMENQTKKNIVVSSTIEGEKQVHLEYEASLMFSYMSNEENMRQYEKSYPFTARFKMCQKTIRDKNDPKKTSLVWGFELEYFKTNEPVIAEICKGKGWEIIEWNLKRTFSMEKIDVAAKKLLEESKADIEYGKNASANQGKLGKSRGFDQLSIIFHHYAENEKVDIKIETLKKEADVQSQVDNAEVAAASAADEKQESPHYKTVRVFPELCMPEEILNNWLDKWGRYLDSICDCEPGSNPEHSPEALLLFMISDEVEIGLDKTRYSVFDATRKLVVKMLYAEKAEYTSAGKCLCDIFGKELIERRFSEAKQKVAENIDINQAGYISARKNSGTTI